MSGINLSVESNVTIRCFNERNKLIKTSFVHNKATTVLVEGILRYLKGDFTPSKYSISAIHDSSAAIRYLPTQIQFGNIGVQTEERPYGTEMRPYLSGVDSAYFKYPTFNEKVLQRPFVYGDLTPTSTKFESADITSFDDTNNSMALLLQTFVPAKTLVGYNTEGIGFTPYPWSYWNQSLKKGNGEWETMITELGLYSDNQLLARVLLDGLITIDSDGKVTYNNPDYPNNPIFQSESSSMIIEWRLGIVSIGPNDVFMTDANIQSINP